MDRDDQEDGNSSQSIKLGDPDLLAIRRRWCHSLWLTATSKVLFRESRAQHNQSAKPSTEDEARDRGADPTVFQRGRLGGLYWRSWKCDRNGGRHGGLADADELANYRDAILTARPRACLTRAGDATICCPSAQQCTQLANWTGEQMETVNLTTTGHAALAKLMEGMRGRGAPEEMIAQAFAVYSDVALSTGKDYFRKSQ